MSDNLPLDHTHSFLKDIEAEKAYRKANPEATVSKDMCCVGDHQLANMISEVVNAQSSLTASTSKSWVLGTPNEPSLVSFRNAIKSVGTYLDASVSYTRRIKKIGSEWWVAGSGSIWRYSADLVKIGRWGNPATATATSNTYDSYINDFDVAANGKVAVVMVDSRHIVRVFSADGNMRLFDIGIFADYGNVAANKLYNPFSVLWTADGNLLVSSTNGTAVGATDNVGHVSLYNGTTGAFIRTIFKGSTTGTMQTGFVYNPRYLTRRNNQIYICDQNHQHIGIINASDYSVVGLIAVPDDLTTQGTLTASWQPFDIAFDESRGEALIISYANHCVIALDVSSWAYKWHVGKYGVCTSTQNYAVPSTTGGVFANPYSVAIDGNYILVADASNHRVQRLPRQTTSFNVPYDLTVPAQYRIDTTALPESMAMQNSTLVAKVPIEKIHLPLERVIVPLVSA